MIANPPPSIALAGSAARFQEAVLDASKLPGPSVGERYHHWHKLRHLQPPAGWTHERWWDALKLHRLSGRRTPLISTTGRPFTFVTVDAALAMLHELDSNLRGQIELPAPVATQANRERYLVSSLSEEAISSSLLEGAVTTRRKAKELLASQREPRSVGEKMVLNNYQAMNWLRERKDEPLTSELVLELHQRMTAGTLDVPDAEGRLRRNVDGADIVLRALDSEKIVPTPPPAAELPARLETMCAWANEKSNEPFVHPVVRSIVLHFWLAYDHPFVDGNGRTARALFYWSMLRHGYWMAEFLPISRLFLKAPARYANAFQYVETDEGDLTYFILFHLRVLQRAADDLRTYLARKSNETRAVTGLLRASANLNHRQIDLLTHALLHEESESTIESHRHKHGVVYQSARSDLLDLAARGVLIQRKVGRKLVFVPATGLETRLRRLR